MDRIKHFEKAAGMLKVIAHPVRLDILTLLVDNDEMNVKSIQKAVSSKQATTSQNLSLLSGKGILARRREGNEVYYSIGNKNIINLLSCIKGCCKN